MRALLLAALSFSAAPRAIEIEFPHEVTLSFAQKAAALPLKARWVGADGPALTAWASFGRIDGWRRHDGGWIGEWLPPDPAFPGDLQIVVSTLQGDRITYSAQTVSVSAVIELPGKSEADAQVEVLVAGEVFGPIRAGGDGRFKLPITVPPNVSTAVARSKDKLGNVFKKTVDLYVPKVSTAALACPSSRVIAGGGAVPVQLVNGSQKRLSFTPPQALKQDQGLVAHVDFVVDAGPLGKGVCVFAVSPEKAADARIVFDPPYLAAQTTIAVYVLDRFKNRRQEARVVVREGDRVLGEAPFVATRQRFELSLTPVAGVEQRHLSVDVSGAFVREATLEQVPDRGVRLTAKREGDSVLITIVPAEAPIVATDARGVAVPLAPVSAGVFRAKVSDAEKFVLVTHAESGTSVLVRLP